MLKKYFTQHNLFYLVVTILVGIFLRVYKISSNYVELLGQWGMLVMSAYFGGRTLEKIMDMKNKAKDDAVK